VLGADFGSNCASHSWFAQAQIFLVRKLIESSSEVRVARIPNIPHQTAQRLNKVGSLKVVSRLEILIGVVLAATLGSLSCSHLILLKRSFFLVRKLIVSSLGGGFNIPIFPSMHML